LKKILIIGAGAQGGPCASILTRDKDISEIILADLNLELANRIKDRLKSDKISVVQVDAAKIEDIERTARGVDIVINLTLCRFNENIMKAALRCKAHYVDSAFADPIWTQFLENQPIEIGNQYKNAGLTALVGCGGAPGLVNVMARYICDKLDVVNEIHIKVGDRLLEESGDVIKIWEPKWCPEIALGDYVDDPIVFEDGEYKKHPPFSGIEQYDFPAPVGRVLIGYHSHEEPVTLPRFIGKGVKYVGFKYPIDPIAAAFVKMGFASADNLEVKGVSVAPRDVLLKLVHPPVDTFFTENEHTSNQPPKSAHPYLLEIKGQKSGESQTYKIWWPSSLVTDARDRREIYKKFGTTNIAVALPIIAGAKICMERKTERGLIAPECLDPMKFLKEMANTGWSVKFHEMLYREVSVQ